MRFFGNIEAKADMKGRFFFPSSFRKQMQAASEEKLILRKDIHQPCLVLYPESVWNQQLHTLRSRLNRWDASHQSLFRQFVSDVEIVTPDANGRILIPKRYLKCTGIVQEACFIGMDDTIELWAKEAIEKSFIRPEEFALELGKIMNQEPANLNKETQK